MKWNKVLLLIFAICFSQFSGGQSSEKQSDKPITITGKVYNDKERPVVGAVLYIDNMKTTNTTKSDGTYKIKVSPTAVNLEVRSSQFGNCVTPINGHTVINFRLDQNNGTASTPESGEKPVKTKHKKNRIYNDIYQMIRAEVTGVVVTGHRVQIQQGHSFFGSSTPLFVINGVIVQSIDNVNPVEVKSIKVLKGSSAAIYGVQGSNGVISITLKNGTESD